MNKDIQNLIEREAKEYMYSEKYPTGHYTDVSIEQFRNESFIDGASFALSLFKWIEVSEDGDNDELTQPPKFKEVCVKTNWGRVTSGILGHSNWNLDFDLGRDEIITEWMPIPQID